MNWTEKLIQQSDLLKVKVTKEVIMPNAAVMGIARHLLTIAGGFLVAQGTIDAAGVETLIGAGVAIVGVVWSIWDKKAK